MGLEHAENSGWVATGVLVGLTVVGLTIGAALVSAGIRLPRWAASLIGLALIGSAIADGAKTGWGPSPLVSGNCAHAVANRMAVSRAQRVMIFIMRSMS